MECKSPHLSTKISDQIDPEKGMPLQYGFNMDHVENVRNLKDSLTPFLLFPTPKYKVFEDDGVIFCIF